MAVASLGAPSPTSSPQRTLHLVPTPGLLDVAERVEAMLTRQRWQPGDFDPEAQLLRDARAAIAQAKAEDGGRAPLYLVPSSRTRRNHGTFVLGGHLACVYSSRQASRCYGVSFEVGAGTLVVNGSMTPAQARSMARALNAAADAVEQVSGGVQ